VIEDRSGMHERLDAGGLPVGEVLLADVVGAEQQPRPPRSAGAQHLHAVEYERVRDEPRGARARVVLFA
jgi:hypothetical protein